MKEVTKDRIGLSVCGGKLIQRDGYEVKKKLFISFHIKSDLKGNSMFLQMSDCHSWEIINFQPCYSIFLSRDEKKPFSLEALKITVIIIFFCVGLV